MRTQLRSRLAVKNLAVKSLAVKKSKVAPSADVSGQIDRLAIQLARQIHSLPRKIFAIVEQSVGGSQLIWPREAFANQPSIKTVVSNRAAADDAEINARDLLLSQLETRLPAAGTWCVLDGFGANDAVARIRPTRIGKTQTTQDRNLRIDPAISQVSRSPMEGAFAALISHGNEREICSLLTQLTGEFEWIGIYVMRSQLSVLTALLRHCAAVYVALDHAAAMDASQVAILSYWQRERIALQGAWLVGS